MGGGGRDAFSRNRLRGAKIIKYILLVQIARAQQLNKMKLRECGAPHLIRPPRTRKQFKCFQGAARIYQCEYCKLCTAGFLYLNAKSAL